MKNVHRRALLSLLHEYKKYYLFVLLMSLCSQSVPFLNLLYSAKIVASIVSEQLILAGKLVCQYLVLLLVLKSSEAFLAPKVDMEKQLAFKDIRQAPYQKMLKLDFHIADQTKTKELLNSIDRQMYLTGSSMLAAFEDLAIIIPHIVGLVWSVLLVLSMFFYIHQETDASFWISPWMIVFLIGIAVIGIIVNQRIGKIGYQFWSKNITQNSELSVVNNIYYYYYNKLMDSEVGKEIRLYQVHNKIIPYLHQQRNTIMTFLAKYQALNGLQQVFSQVFMKLITICLYIIIGINVLTGTFTIDSLIQLTGVIPLLMNHITKLLSIQAFFIDEETLQQYYAFMDQEDAVKAGSIPVEKRLDNNYHLQVDDLSFCYPDTQQEVLHQITEDFTVGKKYAIVGENGSGKTTFIKCLMRLYKPARGQIQLNGIDIQKYDVNEYYSLFGIVFQDYRLLDFTIAENIAVHQQFDEEKINQLIEKLEIKDLIEQLPNGIRTYLGQSFEENGVQLSGGQAQKIAIARAMYKDAPIMILDEPTASLDPIAENQIYQHFNQLTEGKTAFYISHRLSSCRFCDEILVFHQGRIVQRGTHQQLVTQKGKYQELWNAQAEFYLN